MRLPAWLRLIALLIILALWAPLNWARKSLSEDLDFYD